MPNISGREKKRRGRTPTDPHWRERVYYLVENEGLGPRPLTVRLKQEAERLGRVDAPEERTVARFRAAYIALNEPARRAHRAFRWPESMGTPELPWEASAAALELLGYLRQLPSPTRPWERPTVGFVAWFWRVTLAGPGASVTSRFHGASVIYAGELYNGPGVLHSHALEWFLAFAPWRSAEAEQAYIRAVEAYPKGTLDPVGRTLTVLYGKQPEWSEFTSGPIVSVAARYPHNMIEQREQSREEADDAADK